jgi:predicted nicotinamide N-methyase
LTIGRTAFIRVNTRLAAPPCVPEIRLHLADDAISLWEKTEAELGCTGLAPPFWAFAWAGGQALARYVLDHPELIRGHRVLDLAAGCGLVAIAAAVAGAAAVTASEVDELAVAAIDLNARANGATVAAVLEDLLDGNAGGAEVVLAGDVFYERTMAARVLPFLGRASERGACVLIGDPERAYLPRRCLEALATYEVRVSRALEDADVKRTTVWRLVPGQCSSGAGSSGRPPAASWPESAGGGVRLSAT